MCFSVNTPNILLWELPFGNHGHSKLSCLMRSSDPYSDSDFCYPEKTPSECESSVGVDSAISSSLVLFQSHMHGGFAQFTFCCLPALPALTSFPLQRLCKIFGEVQRKWMEGTAEVTACSLLQQGVTYLPWYFRQLFLFQGSKLFFRYAFTMLEFEGGRRHYCQIFVFQSWIRI